MGYRIVYGEDPFIEIPERKSRLRLWTAGFALAFVLLVRCFWPQGTALLRQVLLPRGDAATAAFQQMTADIRAGEPIGDAVTAFCRDVVEEAIGEAG